MGGRGAKSAAGRAAGVGGNQPNLNTNTPKVSAKEEFLESGRQFNEAKQAAKKANAEMLEYVDIMGKTHRMWWNGATWTDIAPRTGSYQSENNKYKKHGTYKAEFKEPDSWK